ncbi:glycosyltransferase family 4 protein [Natronosalvus rutilus]|uniref:Glycosyltransferase family 4 protein n=1 Tax=Natronosalvus rutilus TaxID=2953753 RepID=A0A9E7N8C7_9EURY|nr:glycosyltransferase family 4 protein [Natronosalvus rutilus]UTF52741.1 glycosyltransferase family 4 protein [Natronosalvus rutilus]
MEAYLDSLPDREEGISSFDVLVDQDLEMPAWILEDERFSVCRYEIGSPSGTDIIKACMSAVKAYIQDHDPKEVRQITQPRWHAPGVLLGSRGESVRACTRVSQSNFTEYGQSSGVSQAKDYLVNNIIGKSVFLADRVYTPLYGGVKIPWWSSAALIEEPRIASPGRFNPDVDAIDSVFVQESRRVLTVGRISYKKGVDLVLDAAELLPDWEFVLVGPARDDDLVDRAARLPNVFHHGSVDYVEMPRYYAACDVLLAPSRVEWGGISRSMLEAIASDRDVIALDLGDANQIAMTVTDSATEIAQCLRDIPIETEEPMPETQAQI